ncbi:hypothetical protein PhCBS80983_g05737 [Powellomyces hirtus]|uniref:Pre-mRNA-splicing factor SPF27 n=1 Tax=Powellomyces hirtus TaxID=109895 RepID=A0A507DSS5_9FUNG|nr:hypothetical protein PhCBS80983_g05737 [Powellomyces hirtus]
MSGDATREDMDVFVDSLPYIDRNLPEVSDAVEELIKAELARGSGVTHSSLPAEISLFASKPLLSAELARTANSQPISSLDTTRFRLEPPKDAQSVEAWSEALENAQSQLEHQTNRLINLELVNTFGSNAWRLHCFQLEWLAKALEKEVEAVKKEVVDINKERKVEQLKTGQTLQQLSLRYSQLLHQTMQVDAATKGLETEVEALRAKKEELQNDA